MYTICFLVIPLHKAKFGHANWGVSNSYQKFHRQTFQNGATTGQKCEKKQREFALSEGRERLVKGGPPSSHGLSAGQGFWTGAGGRLANNGWGCPLSTRDVCAILFCYSTYVCIAP